MRNRLKHGAQVLETKQVERHKQNNFTWVMTRGIVCLAALLLSACSGSALLRTGPATLGPLEYVSWARNANAQAIADEQVRLQTLLDDGIATIPSLQFSILAGVQTNLTDAALADALVHSQPGAVACGLSGQCQSYMEFREVWHDYLRQRQQLATTNTRLRNSEQQIMELDGLVQSLRQQIEELTLIEQDIVEREQPLGQQ